MSQKLLRLSKNALTKSFLEFNLIYNRFCLKRLRLELQKLRIAIFGHIWLKLPVFSIFDPLKNIFQQSLHSKIPLDILKPLIYFESKT